MPVIITIIMRIVLKLILLIKILLVIIIICNEDHNINNINYKPQGQYDSDIKCFSSHDKHPSVNQKSISAGNFASVNIRA